MFDPRIVTLMLVSLTGGLSVQPLAAAEPTGVTHIDSWSKTGWPLLRQYCLDCHNADYQEAELDLSGFQMLSKMDDGGAGSMQRVLEMVRFGAMPPEDADQPSTDERKALVSSLDETLFAVSCDLRPRPGKVTARRLNRAEYNNTIRDLFGIDFRPADTFPSDEVGAGFDNNGDVLSLSPLLVEKYLDAAEAIASRVVIDPATLPSIEDEQGSDLLLVHGDTQAGSFYGRYLAPDAFLWANFEIPVEGKYRVRIKGGKSWDQAGAHTVAIYDQNGLLRGTETVDHEGGGSRSERFSFDAWFAAGALRLYLEPIEGNDHDLKVDETQSEYFANLDRELIDAAVERQKKGLKPNRHIDKSKYPFVVREIEVSGPIERAVDPLPPSHHQIMRRVARLDSGDDRDPDDDKWYQVAESAAECLKPLMRRAFRGQVSDAEVEPYANLVVEATERGESYYRGMQIAISAVLVSPRFLFRLETPPDDWDGGQDEAVALTPHQLATRLSYFLWSSTPDEALLAAADDNELSEDQIEAQVLRMIDDPRSESLANQFAAQWLGLRDLAEHEADTDKFRSFTDTLRVAMARETELVFMDMVRNNRPVTDLLTTEASFLNNELAAHYGIEGVDGDEFREVSLSGTPRRGILSHASMLTLTSNPGRTSPVRRGKWILENVLGTPPPEPPAGVPELEETQTASENASLREQMEIHRTDPTCAACHRVMDDLGFGLEQYDAIGRFRTKDGGADVDASGELPGGRAFNGAAELSDMLSKTESEAFAKTVVARLMTFALGRELSPTDRCTVDEIVMKTSEEDFRFVDLVLEVVRSRPFQYYEWN